MEAMGTDAKNLSARRDATNERDAVVFRRDLRVSQTGHRHTGRVRRAPEHARGARLGDILGGSGDRCAYLMSAVGVFSAAVIAPLLALVVAMSVA